MGNMKKRKRTRRSGLRMQVHKMSILAIIGIILMLAAVVSINSVTLRAREEAYIAQETELKKQIEEEEARASEIDDLEKYVGTDEYVEEIAREKLGLVYDGEIIFKAK